MSTSTSTTADELLARVAKAAQDCRYAFGETVEVGPNTTTTPVLHAPGPEARREYDAANLAAQERANALAATGRGSEAWVLLVLVAEAQTADYPQYRGHWNDHELGVMTRRWEGKGGVRAEAGDAVLVAPDELDGEPRLIMRAARTDCDFMGHAGYARVLS